MQDVLFFLVVFLQLHATGSFSVRLSGGPNLCVGRVEVFHQGEWGTVCDDDWDMRDVAVVCRELDCGEGLSAPPGAWFGEGTGPIWLNEVRCVGTEWQLHACRHLGFRKHVCTHEEDASAICSAQRFPPFTAFPPHTSGRRSNVASETAAMPVSPTPAEGSTALRLVGGRSRCSGRLEVFHEGQWGSVCDDMWDLMDVAVVCRELGCGEALAAPGSAFFGEGSSAIWLDDVQCQGKEAMLAECLASPWGTHNCRHTEDAGAVCSGEMPLAMVEEHLAMLTRTIAPQRPRSTAPVRTPHPTRSSRLWAEHATHEPSLHKQKSPTEGPSEVELGGQWQVRLVGGPGFCAGRVEVLYKGQWGTVCDDGWDLVDAAVVCRELGCGAPLLSTGNARYGPGSGPIWLDDVNCTGTESTLRRCRSQPWGQHNCNHHEDASVICTGRWKPLSLSKAASDSNVAGQTPDPTTQDPGPADLPGLQSTFDMTEATVTPQESPTTWEVELSNTGYPEEPFQMTHNVEYNVETQSMSPWDIAETTPIPEIPQHVQETKSTSPPKTSLAHQREQEPTYPSVKSHPPHTMQELESERESEPTSPQDMNEIILNPGALQHVQEMKLTSPPQTSPSTHRWEQVATFSSTESQPPSAMWGLESERETEPINPSGTELPTVTQGLKPATEKVLPIHWDNTPAVPPVTQNKEVTPSSAETQPTSATWGLEPARETEAIEHVGMKKALFSDSLEATSEMQLPAITPTVQPLKDVEVVSFDVIDSEEIRSLKDQVQQERSNTDSHTMPNTESTSAPNASSSWDGTDVHDTTALLPKTVLPTVYEDGQLADGLESSGDTEKGENSTNKVTTPGLTEAPGPSRPSVEPVIQVAKLSKSSPGCPVGPQTTEPRKEDQSCCCSPTALGTVVHAMEGLHEELGSLSSAIKHQGSQLEMVAHSLAQLAASVNHLVGVLPGLLRPSPAQPPSVSYRQEESQVQNQLPLK
ncbi:hypothetical protein lerEdw1_010213 [Lerista edwardsae]|nr:hypothetical protein lerEdw1_010213 [Lerista edwardsae]